MCPVCLVRYLRYTTSFDSHSIAGTDKTTSFATLFELYCSLRQGKMLHEWIMQNRPMLGRIDVRRFISFGVIKGFLYRVHRYPILSEVNNDKKLNDKSRSLRRYISSFLHRQWLISETFEWENTHGRSVHDARLFCEGCGRSASSD
jgi:Nitrogen permease regulator 2